MPCINCKSSETSKALYLIQMSHLNNVGIVGTLFPNPLIELDYSD